ncbi:MAG: glutamate racemase, partial [Microscillaceae bacterium]|nr:glutamate racemase [Microscillaceae bacterium]MDW8460879.1 glutamate racemase [Cytophagales bacterium]
QNIELQSLATPLLAPMIEEGFFNKNISKAVIQEYLSNPILADIQALILACTHYPLIKEEIADFYQHKVEILDSSLLVANYLKQKLTELNLLQVETRKNTILKFYISDYTQSFEQTAQFFFGRNITLEHYPLWE